MPARGADATPAGRGVMIRSYLFVPGDDERKLSKAASSGADALILDLEDAVAPDRKPAARSLTLAYLGQRPPGTRPQRFVRVNAFMSGLMLEDLAAVLTGRPDGIVVPKLSSQAELETIGHYLSALEAREGVRSGATKIVGIVTETARSVMNLAGGLAHPRLVGMMWGAEDLAAELGAASNRDDSGRYAEPFQMARALCLLAAKAAGVAAIDAVFTALGDRDGLAAESRAARRVGFAAKAAIHPAQIAIIRDCFAPTEDELKRARRIVEAFARAPTKGAVRLDGQMLDQPHLRWAEELLASHD